MRRTRPWRCRQRATFYTRRGEGLSIWIVPSNAIVASDPADKEMMFEPTVSKAYRHPTFYDVPDEVGHM